MPSTKTKKEFEKKEAKKYREAKKSWEEAKQAEQNYNNLELFNEFMEDVEKDKEKLSNKRRSQRKRRFVDSNIPPLLWPLAFDSDYEFNRQIENIIQKRSDGITVRRPDQEYINILGIWVRKDIKNALYLSLKALFRKYNWDCCARNCRFNCIKYCSFIYNFTIYSKCEKTCCSFNRCWWIYWWPCWF